LQKPKIKYKYISTAAGGFQNLIEWSSHIYLSKNKKDIFQ